MLALLLDANRSFLVPFSILVDSFAGALLLGVFAEYLDLIVISR